MNKVIDTEQVIESKQILKDLHQVLVDAKKRCIYVRFIAIFSSYISISIAFYAIE